MHHILLATLGLLFFVSSAVHSQQPAAACDEALARMNVDEARRIITEAFQRTPDDYEIRWRMARQVVMDANAITNDDDAAAMAQQAVAHADKAVALNGKGMAAYIYRAAANGIVAKSKGVFKVGGIITKARDDVSYAIQLNNATPQLLALANYILGTMHRELASRSSLLRGPVGLGWGNDDDALRYLKKARDLRPGFIMYELEYARALEQVDRTDEALAIARAVASMKLQDAGDGKRKQRALKLVEEWE